MAPKWLESITGPLDQKKQYREAKARMGALPEPYAAVAGALHRYLLYYGGFTDGDTLVRMITDLADLWERASIDGAPVRGIVGDDPVGFAEEFARAYDGKEWIDKERRRLVETVEIATGPGRSEP